MSIEIRVLTDPEIGEAVALWEKCGLNRPWSDPAADARRALAGPSSTIMATFAAGRLIGTAMCGWDGRHGWIYYLCVTDDFRRWGVGRKLMKHSEEWLSQFGAPQIQLMLRAESDVAASFCEAVGYEEDNYRIFYRPVPIESRREQQCGAM
jgi:GNAT superfamily N-acetyltransferase